MLNQMLEVVLSGEHYVYTKYGCVPMDTMTWEHGVYVSSMKSAVIGCAKVTLTFSIEDVESVIMRDSGYYEVHLK